MASLNPQAILQQEVAALQQLLLDGSHERAVALLHQHVHEKGGKLVTAGMGKAGQIAANMATTFSSTGTPARSSHRAVVAS